MSKFSNEILCVILDHYEFESFQDMRKISLICKLFYAHMQRIVMKVIIKYDEFKTPMRFTLNYEDKKIGISKEIKISELRYSNIKSIFYNWRALHVVKTSLGSSYYRYFNLIEMHYIVHRNLFYKRYFKFIYVLLNVNDDEKFDVFNIITGRKYVIDDKRGCCGLSFFKLGKLGVDWKHCHDLKFYFNDLILQKLLLFKYLKSKNEDILFDYEYLFEWDD